MPSSKTFEISPELEAVLQEYTGDLQGPDAELAREIVITALKLGREQVSRLDRKIVEASLKEMRHAFRVFAPYKGIRKVTMFGSSRTELDDPAYVAARDFSREVAARDWMVITGAGPGIMAAGNEGAGEDLSFGVNIRLPFEAEPNPYIAKSTKLINFKYFFTRKLTFMKEADAFVLLPGGFGTMDEAFELLTLVQTGKTNLCPIIMLDEPNGTYWQNLSDFIQAELVDRGYVGASDLNLFTITDDVKEAVSEIEGFYRAYHSQRMVGRNLILRLNEEPDDDLLKQLSEEFSDILHKPLVKVGPTDQEMRDEDVPDLPRLSVGFDRQHTGRLRQLIDRLNESSKSTGPTASRGDPRNL
jgi:uncharacterized protein (TIGR00730 family)